jgi:hypothetical protein
MGRFPKGLSRQPSSDSWRSARLSPARPSKDDATRLYQRLGGKAAITAVVDEFVARMAADSHINGFFGATAADPMHLAAFKGKLLD